MEFADSGLLHELDADPRHVGTGTGIRRSHSGWARRLVLQAGCECPAHRDPQRVLSALRGAKTPPNHCAKARCGSIISPAGGLPHLALLSAPARWRPSSPD